MNFLRRWIVRLLQPVFDSFREHSDQQIHQAEIQIRLDMQAELQRVGTAVLEMQKRVSSIIIPQIDSKSVAALGERLRVVEEVLLAASEPRKPGNHITEGHEFGNKIRW